MPGARCTRGLVCKVAQRKAHTSIQVQRRQSGIPCAMVLRLMLCSPRRRIRLVTVAAGLMADRSGRIEFASASLAPATGVGTTRFCRTQPAPFVYAPAARSRETRPAITLRADAAASTASHPAFVTIAIRPSCRDGMARVGRTDLPDGESEIFFPKGLDTFLSRRLICPSGAGVGWAKALLRRAHHLSSSWFERWARGACHRARIRATRWLCPPYAIMR